MMGRREFFAAIARAGLGGAALASLPPWAREALAADPRDRIVRVDRPENSETAFEALGRSWITPNERFYVRNHLGAPLLDRERWRLGVSGHVRNKLTLSLRELQAMPQTEAVVTLECAGNGRGLFELPNTAGIQWQRGAIGTARWKGVRLRDVLERSGVTPEAKHVWLEAYDQGHHADTPPFLRSIPIEKAMDDTLLAHSMNGEPLSENHGAPLRAVVPGWYGMASTKWLIWLRLEDKTPDNHFMVRSYRYNHPGEDAATAPFVQEMRVKSIITHPLAGAIVRRAKPTGAKRDARLGVRVRGLAWAGPAGLRQVDVSADAGASWQPALLVGEQARGAWRFWQCDVVVAAAGPLTILARATDQAGATQPLAARPNANGYGNNSMHGVTFHVRA